MASDGSSYVYARNQYLDNAELQDEYKLTDDERKKYIPSGPTSYLPIDTNDPKTTNYSKNEYIVSCIPEKSPTSTPDPDGHSIWIVNASTKSQVVDSPGYPAAVPKPTRQGLVEIRDLEAEGIGKGLFATADIAQNELIFSERPLIVAPSLIPPQICGDLPPWSSESGGLSREKKMQIALERYEKELQAALSSILPKEKEDVLKSLVNCHTGDGSGVVMGIIRTNAFDASIHDRGTGWGYSVVGELASRINHSCIPNISRTFVKSSFSLQFYAARDIKAGEQLFINYCDPYDSHESRQNELDPYEFVCKCLACITATSGSDQFRRMWKYKLGEVWGLINMLDSAPPDLMGYALQVLKEMDDNTIKEGMECLSRYKHILRGYAVVYEKLGDEEKAGVYRKRFEECEKIHSFD